MLSSGVEIMFKTFTIQKRDLTCIELIIKLGSSITSKNTLYNSNLYILIFPKQNHVMPCMHSYHKILLYLQLRNPIRGTKMCDSQMNIYLKQLITQRLKCVPQKNPISIPIPNRTDLTTKYDAVAVQSSLRRNMHTTQLNLIYYEFLKRRQQIGVLQKSIQFSAQHCKKHVKVKCIRSI